MPLSNAQVRDLETLIHPYTNLHAIRETGPLILDRGRGIYVFDEAGNEYIEGMAGLWCASLGFGDEELVEAAIAQMRKLPYYHLFGGKSQDAAIELGERLKELAPIAVSKVLYSASGSEANDTQIKLVWYMNNALGRPEKKKIISRIKGYHGVTIATASLTGLPNNHRDFDLPIARILHTSCPHHYRFGHDGESEAEFSERCARELEELILREGPDTVAAFISEPVMGAGGVIVPPAGYFEKIGAVLRKYDVYWIDDEVICGFGRTGEWFGATTLGMKPDTITVAKQMSGAYVPISAVLIPEQMNDALVDQSKKIGVFGHGFTYGGHPVGCAVGVATLDIYKKRNVLGHVQSITPHFQRRLLALGDHPLVGEARGLGLMGAVELVADKATKQPFQTEMPGAVAARCVAMAQKHGLIVRNIADSVAFCPPMIITESEIDEMFDRMGRALDDTEAWVRAENLRTAA